MKTAPLVRVVGLTKHFPVTRGVFGRKVGTVKAVDGISFELARGETLGLVGESGCGKTTAGRALLRLIEPTSGQVEFEGQDLLTLSSSELRARRRDMQIIFQDPYSSLNPRMRIRDIVGEALGVHGVVKRREVEARVADLLQKVGVTPGFMNRYPHEFSGGQRQRIGIARAIALNPKFIVCDEAVSALDVSIRAQVINLLLSLREELGLSYLFISHDLSVVRHISSRVAVMYLGQIVELADVDDLFVRPAHPYTRSLLSAIPLPDPHRRRQRRVLAGDVPTPLDPPSGCRFHTRCPAVFERCANEAPELVQLGKNHSVRCHHAAELPQGNGQFEELDRRIVEAEREHTEAHPSAPSTEHSAPSAAHRAQRTEHPVPEDRVGRPPEVRVEAALGHAAPPRARPDSGETFLDTRWARALVALGFALIVLGYWVTGALIALGTYFGALRRRLERPLAYDLGLLALFCLALPISSALTRQQAESAARTELAALSEHIKGYHRTTGSYPDALGNLGWRLYETFPDGKPNDPWGRSYVYRAPTKDHAGRLSSKGADERSAADDLGLTLP